MTDPLYTAHTSTIDATPSLPTDVEPCGCDHSQLREAQLIDALLASVRAQERAEQYRAECEGLRGELEAMRPVCEAAVAWRRCDESEPIPSEKPNQMLERVAFAVDAFLASDLTGPGSADSAEGRPADDVSADPAPDLCSTCRSQESCGPNPPFAVGCPEYVPDPRCSQPADAPKETGWLNPDGSYENRAGTYLDAAYVPEALRVAVAEAARPVNAADMDKVLRRAESAERELAELRGRVQMVEEAANTLCHTLDERLSRGSGHYHWDSTMSHGAGCVTCAEQREGHKAIRAAQDVLSAALTQAQDPDHA